MNSNTIVKIILFIFFTTFFGFLFWYFYQPEIKFDKEGNEITKNESFLNLFPFSGSEDYVDKKKDSDKKNKEQEEQEEKKVILEEMPQLRQISKIPTAGVFIESLSKTELFDINKNRKRNLKLDEGKQFSEIRYISQKNNHVYQTYDFTKTENRISNVTIPKVFSALFFDKNNFIIRYKNDFGSVKNYSVTLLDRTEEEIKELKKEKKNDFDKNEKKFQGIFFPDNIEQIFVNKKTKNVLYTTFLNTDGVNDKKIHIITSTSGAENKKEIFSSDLKEWNFNFNNDNKVFVSNKVSSKTPSIPFSLNTKNGQFLQISSAERSLNGIPNYNFSKIVFSQRNSDSNELELVIFNTKTKEKKKVEISTFVEKCVWSSNNVDIYCAVPLYSVSENQPDDWYKGKNYFRDDIFKINTNTLSMEIVFDSLIEEKSFDIVNLKIDDREKYLYWIDKKTDFAWSYKTPYSGLTVAPTKLSGKTFSGKKCESNLVLNQNLQPGDRNGKYSNWQKEVIVEVKILQKHMNRLGFNAGVEDGILGKNTAGAIKRMQKFLGTYQDAKVGPITRNLLNNSC